MRVFASQKACAQAIFLRNITICDSGVVGNARPCQGRDRGFEPRLSLYRSSQDLKCKVLGVFSYAIFFVQSNISCDIMSEKNSKGDLNPENQKFCGSLPVK